MSERAYRTARRLCIISMLLLTGLKEEGRTEAPVIF